MARKGTLTVRLVGDDRRLRKTLDNVGGKVASFAKAAAAAGGAAALAFGVKAVRGAVDLNETLSKTNQVFKGAAGEVIGFADDMAAAFGLPKNEILDAASNIGLVAKASGLSADAAADMSTEMAQLAADASSFFNVPLPDALEKIRAGLVGEAEPLRSFGVLLSAAAVEAKAVELGIADANTELTEQQKVMARAAIITDQMSDASGDLERTQESLANRWRELQGRVENFAAEVGQNLIPWIERLWDWLEEKLPPALAALQQAWQDNEETLTELWNHLGEIMESFGTILANVMGTAVDDSETAGDSISDSLGTIAEALEQVVSGVDAVMDVFEAVTGWLDTPLGRLVQDAFEAMTSLSSIIQGVRDDWRSLQSALGNTKNVGAAIPKGVGSVPAGIIGLHEGGIVKARPGGIIANIGEGGEDEAVVPLSKLRNMVGGGQMDPDVWGRRAADAYARRMQTLSRVGA